MKDFKKPDFQIFKLTVDVITESPTPVPQGGGSGAVTTPEQEERIS